ncbi:serine/threonine protein kinase [Sabulicella glaciei]|uniref:serine/threonine protein kinase n=1 Tax=Sabulicella glaciei TaxID=2984948 RepID=UPI0026588C5E|nr:hypothetical protein [Roseococcus sp. MDT2-1-1]
MNESFPPELLDRYRPDWVIGRSRSSIVWAVTERAGNRPLALKQLSLSVMAHVWPRHPHLVTVVDQPRWDMPAMERLRALPLRDWASPGEVMAPAAAIALLLPLFRALRCLHVSGVAHGGLHGGNVLVRGPADPVLLEPETGRVPVLGAAPEILCGEAPHPGADIWAAGVLAYLLLTGQPPWAGAPEAMRERVLEEPMVPPRSFNDAIPESLSQWLLRCLARSAARRFADAEEALAALEAVLREEPAMIGTSPRVASGKG